MPGFSKLAYVAKAGRGTVSRGGSAAVALDECRAQGIDRNSR
jgi:hypothetical protein